MNPQPVSSLLASALKCRQYCKYMLILHCRTRTQVSYRQEAMPTSLEEASPDLTSLEALQPLEEPPYARSAAYGTRDFSGQAADPYSSQDGAGLASQAFSGSSIPAYEAAQPDPEAQLLQEAALAQSLQQVKVLKTPAGLPLACMNAGMHDMLRPLYCYKHMLACPCFSPDRSSHDKEGTQA